MNNQEIYNKLLLKHGKKKMLIFCDVVSDMYAMLYVNDIQREIEEITENSFHRDFWKSEADKLWVAKTMEELSWKKEEIQ